MQAIKKLFGLGGKEKEEKKKPDQQQNNDMYQQNQDNNDFPMEQQIYADGFGEQAYGGYGRSGNGIRLISQETEEEKKKQLVAVIITICDGSTYDGLFSEVKQESDEGTRVRVYQANLEQVKDKIFPLLQNEKKIEEQKDNEVLKGLIEDIKSVEQDGVVWNWECCSQWGDSKFPDLNNFHKMLQFFIKKGHFLMFSDFSLKSLIMSWDSKYLGPNPFIKSKTECVTNIQLFFDPQVLKDCDSAQLQKVGDLCEKGECNVHAISGTIIYSVDFSKTDTDKYELEVLTVAKTIDGKDPQQYFKKEQVCDLQGKVKGAAGHILLKYPEGGKILTSMGHWVELMKLDTTSEQLMNIAKRDYGEEYQMQMEQELNMCADDNARNEYVSSKAKQFVQQSAPCKSKKAKY